MSITKSSYAQAAANIKKELAAAFPGIKFSVRSKSFSMGDSVDVSWTFGPTSREVDAIISKYAYGHFDGYTGSYDNHRDDEGKAFRAANGSAKYVSAQREIPFDTFTQICKDIAVLFTVPFSDIHQRRNGDTLGLSDYADRALSRTSFPVDAQYLAVAYGFEIELTGASSADNLVRIIHSKTNEETDMREVVKMEFDRIRALENIDRPRLTLLRGPSAMEVSA